MNARRLAAMVLLLGIAGSSSFAAPRPLAEIRLEPYRKSVSLRLPVNGKLGHFLLDTGGGVTLLSPAFAERVGCKPWGHNVGFRMTGEKVANPRCENVGAKIGSVQLHAPTASILDVTTLLPKGAAPVDGSIALDLFSGRALTIDVTAGRLTIESPGSLAERRRHGRELPLRLSREVSGVALEPFVEIRRPAGVVRFELDSGNGGSLLVSREFATAFGLDPAQEGPQAGRIEVAPDVVAEGPTFTPELTIDGNLGMPFFRRYAITFDLAAGRMWVAPTEANGRKHSR